MYKLVKFLIKKILPLSIWIEVKAFVKSFLYFFNRFKKTKNNTAITFAMISSNGKRRYLTNWGANDIFSIKDLVFSNIQKYSLIHLCGTFAMKTFDGKQTLEFVKKIKKNKSKILISMDTIFNTKVNCLKLIKDLRNAEILKII